MQRNILGRLYIILYDNKTISKLTRVVCISCLRVPINPVLSDNVLKFNNLSITLGSSSANKETERNGPKYDVYDSSRPPLGVIRFGKN